MDISEMNLKFIWKGKISRLVYTMLKNKVEGQTLLNFKTYYKAMLVAKE